MGFAKEDKMGFRPTLCGVEHDLFCFDTHHRHHYHHHGHHYGHDNDHHHQSLLALVAVMEPLDNSPHLELSIFCLSLHAFL